MNSLQDTSRSIMSAVTCKRGAGRNDRLEAGNLTNERHATFGPPGSGAMEVEPVFASHFLSELRARNASETCFTGIISDYQELLKRHRELQVRNAQLDKEAGELRLENAMLTETADLNRVAAVNSQEVSELRERANELQGELNAIYKEKAKLAEDLLESNKRLQIVRENFEQHDKTLTERGSAIKDLKASKKDLSAQVDHLKAAHAEAVKELQARLKDKEEAQQRVQALEQDNLELSRRMVEMKTTEIERMNEVNRLCDEMMRNAQSMERAAAAEASSRSRQVLGKLFGANTRDARAGEAPGPALVDQLKGLTMRSQLIASRIPSGEARTVHSHGGGGYALAFDRSGSRLASGGGDKVVRLWEPATGAQTSQLHGMQDMVTDVAFTCDQNHLVAAGTDKTLRVWDLDTARVRHTLTGHSDKVSSVSCSPVDRRWAASGSVDRAIKMWDLTKGFVAGNIMHASRCHSVRWSLDGGMLVSGHLNGSLCFWDRRSHKSIHEVAGLHTQQIVSIAVGLHSGVILTCGKDHVLKLVDTRSFQVRGEMRAPGFTVGNVWCSAALSADEHHVAAGSVDGTIFIWESERVQVVKTVKDKGAQGILACSWSPQGTPLITTDRVGAMSFWEG